MIIQRQFWKKLTRLHRWAGMILGVQILIWFLSGFFMSFFDIDTVRGAYVAKKASFLFDMTSVKPLSGIKAKHVTTATLKGTAGGGVVYVISGDNGTCYLTPIRAISGRV